MMKINEVCLFSLVNISENFEFARQQICEY